jgi:hypothetical protein
MKRMMKTLLFALYGFVCVRQSERPKASSDIVDAIDDVGPPDVIPEGEYLLP